MLIRRGPKSQFAGPAFEAADPKDVQRLAEATGRKITTLPESLGGVTVDLVDPSGLGVRVVSGTHQLPALRAQAPLRLNFGHDIRRINDTQRPRTRWPLPLL